MNVFSGSRRIAIVMTFMWVAGFLIAGMIETTIIHARYDFILGQEYASFAGFDLYGCPEKTEENSFEFKTDEGHKVMVTFCVAVSTIDYEALARQFGGILVDSPATASKEKINSSEYFAENFKIQKKDQDLLNEKWWQSWRATYGRSFLVMLGGLVGFWLFTFAVGWVARGFMGISGGMDSKR